MNSQKEGLLSAIKALTLNHHLTSLLQLPQPEASLKKSPFEVYQYEQEQLDFEDIQRRMRQDILLTLNQHLYEEEQSKLKMELFSIQEHLQMEEHQICLLKFQIAEEQRAERINGALTSKMIAAFQPKRQSDNRQEAVQKHNIKLEERERSLNIFPCVRVDFEPAKSIPRLPIRAHEDKQTHAKSHRQMLATYTKRSQGSNARQKQMEKDKDITIKNTKGNQQTKDIIRIEQKITFMERAWKEAKNQKRSNPCKKYKRELMDLVRQFWIEI